MTADRSHGRFDASVASLGPIRRLVTEAMTAWGCNGLTDDATLCASELASNAILHTRVPFELEISRVEGGVRIDVIDQRPAELPALVPATGLASDITSQGTTGRGLQIVASLADRWGVTTHGDRKAVWVELRPGGNHGERAEPVVVVAEAPSVDPDRVTLRFLGLPVRAAVANGMHLDGVVRELQLGVSQVDPAELQRMYELLDESSTVRLEARRKALLAASRDEERYDLDVEAPGSALLAVAALNALMADLARTRRATDLPEGVAELREWLHDEALHQLGGHDPRPCPLP